MSKFHIYINFPLDIDKLITSESEIHKLIKHLQIILDRADCEHGTHLYYSESNKNAFFDELIAFEDLTGFAGILSPIEFINLIIQESNAENWERSTIHDINEQNHFYKKWINTNRNIENNIPQVFKEVAERAFRITSTPKEKCIFLDIFGTLTTTNPAIIIRGSLNEKPTFLFLDIVKYFQDIELWFENNRYHRDYNFGDNRHIENHRDYRNRKSPLLGGMAGKENAKSLLKKAVGDQKKHAFLINYDTTYHCYIRYEYENDNPQNLYHGYHLVLPVTHANDLNAEKILSYRIKEILKFRTDNP